MRKLTLAVLLSCLMLATSVWGEPTAVFSDQGPGVNAPFTHNQYTVDYGKVIDSYGWVWDTWSGKCSGPSSLQRYGTTMSGSTTQTAMREDMDWVLSLTFSQTVAYNNETPFFIKHDDDGLREDRVFKFSNVGSATNLWNLDVGNDSGGWYTAVAGVVFDEWQDITVHYKVGLGLDIYLGSVLVASNQETGHGRYDVDFLQMEYLRAGTTAFRVIKLAQLAKECGDSSHQHPTGDLNQDCRVNLLDFSVIAANWLESSSL